MMTHPTPELKQLYDLYVDAVYEAQDAEAAGDTNEAAFQRKLAEIRRVNYEQARRRAGFR